jgi:hypothetical protein
MVEEWFDAGKPEDDRFVFVEKIIRAEVRGGFWARPWDLMLMDMPVEKLRSWSN